MSDPAIRVESVSKRYQLGMTLGHTTLAEKIGGMLGRGQEGVHGSKVERSDFWALRDVSLDVNPGEVVGLIGANGAGKSTLLKLLARVALPTEGRITMNGRVGTLLEVGTGFHPELSGRDNVFLSGAILGMGRREVAEKFDAIVDFSGVSEFIDTPVKRYSSGMYVRLAFAVAAFLEPEILLVDEVLAVGDAEFQRRCLGRMQEVVEHGRTIVFVSHNLTAVQRLCPRSVWLEHGELRMVGPTDEVVAAYLSEVGSTQSGGEASIAPGAVRTGGDQLRLTRLCLNGAAGEPVDKLRLGEPFRVDLSLESDIAIDDAVVELGICASDGARVVTVQSIDRGGELLTLSPGDNEVGVAMDLTLLPGQYHFDVIVHRMSGLTLDAVERVLTFSSLNVSYDGLHFYPWNVVRGAVRAASTWSVAAGAALEGPASPAN